MLGPLIRTVSPSRQDGSNDGSQHLFSESNIENYPVIIPFTPSYLKHCVMVCINIIVRLFYKGAKGKRA